MSASVERIFASNVARKIMFLPIVKMSKRGTKKKKMTQRILHGSRPTLSLVQVADLILRKIKVVCI